MFTDFFRSYVLLCVNTYKDNISINNFYVDLLHQDGTLRSYFTF